MLTPLNSPHPSPLPVRRGEGDAAASPSPPAEGGEGRGEEVPMNSSAAESRGPMPTPHPSPLPVRRGEGEEGSPRSLSFLNSTAVGLGCGVARGRSSVSICN